MEKFPKWWCHTLELYYKTWPLIHQVKRKCASQLTNKSWFYCHFIKYLITCLPGIYTFLEFPSFQSEGCGIVRVIINILYMLFMFLVAASFTRKLMTNLLLFLLLFLAWQRSMMNRKTKILREMMKICGKWSLKGLLAGHLSGSSVDLFATFVGLQDIPLDSSHPFPWLPLSWKSVSQYISQSVCQSVSQLVCHDSASHDSASHSASQSVRL